MQLSVLSQESIFVAIFLVIFVPHMNALFIIKLKFLTLSEWVNV